MLVHVLAYTGLRFGEAAALRVTDVNVLRSRLRVYRSVTQVNGEMVYGSTKTGKARDVAVPKSVMAMITELTEDRAPHDLVFPAANGEPLRLRNVRRDWWNRAGRESKTAGVPAGLTPHELPHTAASPAIRAGASVKSVQRMRGHSSATVTLDCYGHLFEDEHDAVADRLEAHFAEVSAVECSREEATTLRVAR
ncbi:tyrosine-type recombinase/integrase [Nocardia lijiangensis]|uniref:tyrosine-type recombinase/integrase n=1 Tax=Nocardia lijiangensis TaxID=299618 RepID=UPI003D709E96